MKKMRKLSMRYAGGGILRHLGLQNYKGPVPALAELIANAWDADTPEVRITMPLDRPITPEDKIIVKDTGHGMLWEDCEDKYLVIARNRRQAENTDRTKGGRKLMAHKGLGKLAGFGIAKTIEVKTISEGKFTHFIMSFKKIDELKPGDTYYPTMVADEEPSELPNRTEIVLKDLSIQRAIPKEHFISSMSARFSIYSEKFQVYLNDEPLKKINVPTEFRFPEKVDEKVIEIDEEGYGKTILKNGLPIKWWIGFTPDTIKEEELYGISIICRGRVAQDPWDFNLAGGAWGQHGLRYMTGQIIAEFADDGVSYDSDTILTNRSGLNWENPDNQILYDWARGEIRALLRVWSDRRGKKTLEKVKIEHPEIVDKIQMFQPREQKELNAAMQALAQVPTMQPEKLVNIINHVIDGYQDKVFTDLINEIIKLPPEDMEQTLFTLAEFDVFEAIRVYNIVKSHVNVIRRFRQMIESEMREKPDMQEYIRKYPWLLGLKHLNLEYEMTLQTILEKEFGVKTEDDEYSKKRPDFVCMRSGRDVVIIELKRPGLTLGLDHIKQTFEYVYYVRDWVEKGHSERLIGLKIHKKDVTGFLIGDNIKDDPAVKGQVDLLDTDGIHVCKWYDLLMKTEDDYMKYLKIVKRRAPEDDPRIIELEVKEVL